MCIFCSDSYANTTRDIFMKDFMLSSPLIRSHGLPKTKKKDTEVNYIWLKWLKCPPSNRRWESFIFQILDNLPVMQLIYLSLELNG